MLALEHHVVQLDESKHIGRAEWSWALLIALTLTVLVQIPYTLGYWTSGPATTYTGLLVNVEDANYLTIIQRGAEGAWTHSLRFTSEPDAPAFLYVFYLAWGQFARVVKTDATTMWHIARVVMTFLTCVVTFGFVNLFVLTRSQRMVAYVLAVLGGGFDWVAFPWENLEPTRATPVDLKMADAHLFYAALTFPHYLGSIALLMLLFWCAVRLLTDNLSRELSILLLIVGALAHVGVGLVYPFLLILSCSVLALYALILTMRAHNMLWREGIVIVGLMLPVVPLGLYYASALASSALLRVWSAQSQTLSPNPLHYLLTFAPYLTLAVLDVWRVGLGEPAQANKRALLWAWVLVVAVMVYAPLGAQRRFLQGVQVPLALLAVFGLYEVVLPRVRQARWFRTLSRRPNFSAAGLQRLLVVFVLLLVSISSAYQWASAIALTTMTQPYPFFRPRGEIEAMDWLHTRAQPDDVVLSEYYSGSYLPLRSGTRVFIGHYYETIHFADKLRAVQEFFDVRTADAARTQFLYANHIAYVFYGRAESEMGTFDPTRSQYLQRIFENDDAIIFQVIR